MELTFKIKKSPDYIFDYLTNMQKFVIVHPVITKIHKNNDDSYLVYETLKLGFIPFSFTYTVTIDSLLTNNTVIMRATIMKLTKIEMKFVLKQDNDFTIVEENILFKSPLPIKSVMQNIFKKQHQQLFKNIEASKD
jgi:carbon monoxide dehydrogenase subunit G